jgi:hypothetical protein
LHFSAGVGPASRTSADATSRSNRRPHIRKLAGIWQSAPRAGTTRAPRVQELTFWCADR